MATILITGNTELFTPESLDMLTERHRVVIAGTHEYKGNNKHVKVYRTTPEEDKFRHLFDVYSFDAVWYVSGYADGGEGTFGEIQLLEQTMRLCEEAKVEKTILLSTMESSNYSTDYGRNGETLGREYASGRAFTAAQTEELGQFFAKRRDSVQKVIILKLPYVVGRVNDCNYLGKLFHRVCDKKVIHFPYKRDDRVDFLSCMDLAALLGQITDETEDESGVYLAASGYAHSYGELEEQLKRLEPELEVVYENRPCFLEMPERSQELRRIYGFLPMDDVVEDLEDYYDTFLREVAHFGRTWIERIRETARRIGKSSFRYIELLLAFLLAEFLCRYTSDSVYFEFVDVRLFFVVIAGTMYGAQMGTIAALLECVVLVVQYMGIGMGGVQIFYNIGNWIPFAVYIMAGFITGYVRDKKSDEITFEKEEYSLLRDKYLFLNDVYEGTVRNKSEYKRQILGFKDSFGKIFDAVQKLDNELPGKVFLEGLRVLEDILENRSIAIYSLDSYQRFGRLMACSGSKLTTLTKSIRIEEYQELYNTVSRGDVWKNSGLQENLPVYAGGVSRGDQVVLLIFIWEVDAGQYGMDYMNIFRILCGLLQSSFLKALRYEELQEADIYYPNSIVVYPERFRQLVAVQEDMHAAGVADYMLIKFADKNKEELSRKLSGIVRATDSVGAGEDGTLYLLLVQMNRINFGVVAERFESREIQYQIAERVD